MKKIDGRQIEAPELRRDLDYYVGDVVQLKADGKKDAGRIGVIIGIRAYTHKDGTDDLGYRIKLSDNEATEASGQRLRFLSHRGKLPEVDQLPEWIRSGEI